MPSGDSYRLGDPEAQAIMSDLNSHPAATSLMWKLKTEAGTAERDVTINLVQIEAIVESE